MRPTPTFYQLLLAAEVSLDKSRTLAQAFGSYRDLTPEKFAGHPSLTEAERTRVRECDISKLDHIFSRGASILDASQFPPQLDEKKVPPALMAIGDTSCLQQPTVGIVGTRNASVYGRAAAAKFAEAFAKRGLTVVSGGAIGIDAAAHEGALLGGGKTIAVLAGGLDRLYPAMHAALFRRITSQGCLLSSYAFGTKPMGYRFLARNGIIALLSQVLLVVEAPLRSGSINTAHAAGELGRPVFVVPSTIDQLSFQGSHELIKDGATLIDSPDQIFEALNLQPQIPFPEDGDTLNETAKRILGVMSIEVHRVEVIAEAAGLNPDELLAELTFLEMDGKVIRSGGGYALVP